MATNRILLVEYDEGIFDGFGLILKFSGYTFTVFGNGYDVGHLWKQTIHSI